MLFSGRDAAMAGGEISDQQRLAWLRLIRSEGVGPITFRELANHFGGAAAALDALPGLARRTGKTPRICTPDEARRELDTAERAGVRFTAIGEPDCPAWLRAVDDAPPLLAVRGDGMNLARPSVAIVGSRNASVMGRKFAMQIAAGLGDAGLTVTSGLARGIDAAAHKAALATGTVAVFAGGLDRPYPPENVALADEIVDKGGALVSEMPMGWEPRARDFPRRNRIISGLSLAVVVVEGALRSGTLITARRAADQGRLVFAEPGSPLDPRAGATNLLIKEGATIVTAIEDIISEIQPMLARETGPAYGGAPEEPSDAAEIAATGETDFARVVEALGPAPVAIDDLIRFTGLRPAIVHLALIELDLGDRLARHPGGRVSLI